MDEERPLSEQEQILDALVMSILEEFYEQGVTVITKATLMRKLGMDEDLIQPEHASELIRLTDKYLKHKKDRDVEFEAIREAKVATKH